MKTSKFALVIAFVAFATMVFAQAEMPGQNEPAPNQNYAKISLEKALMDRALRTAMYQQIKPGILVPDQKLYTAKVLHNRTVYIIFGTYAEWRVFFGNTPIPDVDPIERAGPKAYK